MLLPLGGFKKIFGIIPNDLAIRLSRHSLDRSNVDCILRKFVSLVRRDYGDHHR